MYAAGKGLERIRQDKFPETHISEMFIKHGDAPEIREFIENMAKIIVVEIQILNPRFRREGCDSNHFAVHAQHWGAAGSGRYRSGDLYVTNLGATY